MTSVVYEKNDFQLDGIAFEVSHIHVIFSKRLKNRSYF